MPQSISDSDKILEIFSILDSLKFIAADFSSFRK